MKSRFSDYFEIAIVLGILRKSLPVGESFPVFDNCKRWRMGVERRNLIFSYCEPLSSAFSITSKKTTVGSQ